MNQKQQGYLKFIAYLQIIGIILVVAGHSFHEYPDGSHGVSLIVYRMLYSFKMPLFLFVSGFLMVYTSFMRRSGEAPSAKRFAVQKIRRLLVPFVVLSLVTFIPRSMMSGLADDPIPLSARELLEALAYRDKLIIPYYWFLQTSFTLLVVSYSFICLCRRARLADGVTYTLLLLIVFAFPYLPVNFPKLMSVDMTVSCGFYFVAGAAYCRFAPAIDRYVRWTSPAVFILFAAIWATLFFLSDDGLGYSAPRAFAGIAMCISFAKILEHRHYTFLDHLTGTNYLIFLLSWFCNVAAQQVLSHFVVLPWWVYTLLSLISGIYIPWLAYRYLLRQ